MSGSGMEWVELATVDKECQQLYEQYKGEDWIREFNKHFACLLPLLEFLLEELETEMMVSAGVLAKTGNTAKHPPCELTITMGAVTFPLHFVQLTVHTL
ncbi:hypothetical protein H2248_000301 [Termitomyces sp. 'cryptogamus']|nr:hypothetical protein H2248_000301 [Termitomyces sp. 'cryptogamus']